MLQVQYVTGTIWYRYNMLQVQYVTGTICYRYNMLQVQYVTGTILPEEAGLGCLKAFIH
jgi:hypothetical protein